MENARAAIEQGVGDFTVDWEHGHRYHRVPIHYFYLVFFVFFIPGAALSMTNIVWPVGESVEQIMNLVSCCCTIVDILVAFTKYIISNWVTKNLRGFNKVDLPNGAEVSLEQLKRISDNQIGELSFKEKEENPTNRFIEILNERLTASIRLHPSPEEALLTALDNRTGDLEVRNETMQKKQANYAEREQLVREMLQEKVECTNIANDLDERNGAFESKRNSVRRTRFLYTAAALTLVLIILNGIALEVPNWRVTKKS